MTRNRFPRPPRLRLLLPLLLFAAWSAQPAHADTGEGADILGWIEWVQLTDPDLRLRAKLDTGATTSSVHAVNKRYFSRDGDDWVSFDILDRENDDLPVHYERPVVRRVRIIRAGGEVDTRPVVEIGMCVGGTYRERQVTLADRSDLNYPVLVGRNFMRGRVIVDSATTYTRDPDCADTEAAEADGDIESDADTVEEESE